MKLLEKTLHKTTSQVKSTEQFKKKLIRILLSLLKRKDLHTADHCKRVMRLAVGYAKYYNYPSAQIHTLKYASLLHDIGKLTVPKRILLKPEKLSKTEFDKIKKHPFTGFFILKNISLFKHEAVIIKDHHERIDGTGYPHGLYGKQINELSKVLSVCDAFDAMTKHRVYRQALSLDEALNELLMHAGSQFDRITVERFYSYLKKESRIPRDCFFTNDI